MNKGTVFDVNINIYCDEHKHMFTEMDHAYRCMRTLKLTDEFISKNKAHVYKTILLWRELKLPVIPSAYLFEDHIVYKIENIIDFLAEKSEDYIERIHQDGKHSEKRYCGLTNFQQSQIS